MANQPPHPRPIRELCLRCIALSFAIAISAAYLEPSYADEHWANWRGPFFNGCAAADARPPIQWDAKTNVKWSRPLLGEGSATPIVWGDQIFVLSAQATDRKTPDPPKADASAKTAPPDVFYRYWVTSIDRRSGEVNWQKLAAEQVPHEGKHGTHTYAAGSPTTDGERLYASFGSRGIYCYTLTGDLVWQVDLGDMHTRLGWGEAVTPALAGDLLIVNWDQESNSFITALNKRTGESVWKVDRPMEATSWNTPLIVQHEGQTLAIVNGTHRVRAYDVKDGKEVWACGGQTVNAIPTPVQFEDTIIAMSGYRAAACMAIPVGARGDITGSRAIRWQVDQGTPYVPSPALSGNRLYFTGTTADILRCIDAKSGKPLLDRKRLSGVVGLYSSPLVAGGHVYFAGREGTTVVVKDDPSFEIAAVNKLEGHLDASPVAIGKQLFLRSWDKLYCIEAP